ANEFLFRTSTICDILSNITFIFLALVLYRLLKQVNERQANTMVVLVLVKINSSMTLTLEVFWGLWLIPFGQLVYKSSFIPRILGILLILGGIAYLIESFTGLLLPKDVSTVNQFTFVFYSLAEISTMLWLLIKGVKSSYK